MSMEKSIQQLVYVALIAVYARDTIRWGLQDVLVVVARNSLVNIHHVRS